MHKLLLTTAIGFIATSGLAQEHREMSAHEHGVSTAEIAVEHGVIEINIVSPGADIVGFEYEAESDADKDAVAAAIRQFLAPEDIVSLPDDAMCRLAEVLAHLHGGDHEHAHDDDHAEDADHADHADDHDGEHDHEDDHADEDAAAHNEFHVRYIFACDKEDALTTIGFPFFDRFENAQEIEVQFVTETGAGIAEITRDAKELVLE